VALAALDDHKPVLVLLPASSPAGEPQLLERLRTLVRGGVPTLRLPPPTSVNPKALAEQIRQAVVGEAPLPPVEEPPPIKEETSEHLVTAAKVAISWIRARRATWSTAVAPIQASAPDLTGAGAHSDTIGDELSHEAESDGSSPADGVKRRETIAAWLRARLSRQRPPR
jgi:hypothetical protein